jgi:hypothetical protein
MIIIIWKIYHLIPLLKILHARNISIKNLINLIENTIGNLVEIKIDQINHGDDDNKRIIQIIYLNCTKLKYLKLLIRNINILELENLLINCQDLIGLYILISNSSDIFNWDKLFKILSRSSSKNLFKFKFLTSKQIKFDSSNIFLIIGRIVILSLILQMFENQKLNHLIQEYKIKGIAMKYNNVWYGTNFRTFEWYFSLCYCIFLFVRNDVISYEP